MSRNKILKMQKLGVCIYIYRYIYISFGVGDAHFRRLTGLTKKKNKKPLTRKCFVA
jgi:hypothetical protein